MAFTQSDLDALDLAIGSGALEVKFQTRTVTYRNLEDMLRTRAFIAGQVNAANGVTPIRQLRVYSDKGF